MKKVLLVFLLIALSIGICACGKKSDEEKVMGILEEYKTKLYTIDQDEELFVAFKNWKDAREEEDIDKATEELKKVSENYKEYFTESEYEDFINNKIPTFYREAAILLNKSLEYKGIEYEKITRAKAPNGKDGEYIITVNYVVIYELKDLNTEESQEIQETCESTFIKASDQWKVDSEYIDNKQLYDMYFEEFNS